MLSDSDVATLPIDQPLYAVVVVQTTLERRITTTVAEEDEPAEEDYLTRSFHYLVPSSLRTQMRVGQLVWVPFGRRYLQGIIIGLDDHTPVEQTREVDQIVDPEPVLSPMLIDLAHWMSNYYLAPIQRVVHTMLPPGVLSSVDVVVRLEVKQVEGATPAQAQILSILRKNGPLTLRQIATLSQQRQWRSHVDQLVEHGWASKRAEIRPPTVKPQFVRLVKARPDATLDAIPANAPRQRQALVLLLQRLAAGDPWLPLSAAAAEAGVAPNVLHALVNKGVLELSQRPIWRDPLEGQSLRALATAAALLRPGSGLEGHSCRYPAAGRQALSFAGRHRERQNRDLFARRPGGSGARAQRPGPGARDRSHASDGSALRGSLSHDPGGDPQRAISGRALRPVATYPRR